MGTFSASLRAIGDVKTLPATVEISDGRLKIAAGSTEIGSWPLDEVQFEEIPTGYRMAAEGDQILIELKDVASFSAALANGSKKKRGRGRRRQEEQPSPAERAAVSDKAVSAQTVEVPVPVPSAPASDVGAAVGTESAPPRQKRQKRQKRDESQKTERRQKPTRSGGSRLLDAVDTLLIEAKKRFGPYLPDFMFSRAMFVITLAVLVVMVVFPGVFSIALLIGGALMVLFGAVVYSDSVLASRWLPGRSTPTQALLLGLGILILGVLLGALAR